jgi:hypothetical protein
MEKEKEEELWNSWSSNQDATIAVDGKNITDVFSAIKKQLDVLRRKQTRFQDDLDNIADDIAEKMMIASAAATPAPVHIDLSEYVKISDIELLQHAMQQLRDDSRLIHDLDKKVKTIETTLIDRSKDLERRIDQLVLQTNDQKLELIEQQNALSNLEKTWESRFDIFLREFQERTQNLEVNQMVSTKEMNDKILNVRDTMTVQDLRAKQFDNRINKSAEEISELQHTLSNFLKKDIPSIHSTITDLFDNKADRHELELKANIEVLEGKASIFDVDKLKDFSEELERRVLNLTQETADRFHGMDSKLDRRSDRIVTWCLKQLRKEFRSLQNAGDEGVKEGTDIGKVRCLVCDHVSTQQRETEIVHSSNTAGLTATFRSQSHKKDRSMSPRSPERGTETMMSNIHNGPSHSRFVKPGASPEVNYGDERDDPDYMADFKYRGTKFPPAVQQQPQSPQTTIPHSQSAPLIQIISHHTADSSHMRLSQLPFHQQQVLSYYKDMEQ